MNENHSWYGECDTSVPHSPSTAVAVPLPPGGRLKVYLYRLKPTITSKVF